MKVLVCHDSATDIDLSLQSQFEPNIFEFSTLTPGRSGSDDEYLLPTRTHHGGMGMRYDIIIVDARSFGGDLLRAIKFTLTTRARFPWMIFVLLTTRTEEQVIRRLPRAARDHLARYFRITSDRFPFQEILNFLRGHREQLGELARQRRLKHLGGLSVAEHLESRRAQVDAEDRAYDFALSFAGAEREHARSLAEILWDRGFRVFFDENEATNLFGRNLAEELYKVYSSEARYCIILVSNAYKNGPWTNQERRAALDKAVSDVAGTYILPVQIENVSLPGLSPSIAYLKWELGPTTIGRILCEKLISDLVAE